MNCHSEIWAQSPALEPVRQSFLSGQPIHWNRVDNLPGYVYFDHSIHVQKGVGCSTCHGPVDQMPLTFKTQIDADELLHRLSPEPAELPAAAGPGLQHGLAAAGQPGPAGPRPDAAYHVQSKIACSTCHR